MTGTRWGASGRYLAAVSTQGSISLASMSLHQSAESQMSYPTMPTPSCQGPRMQPYTAVRACPPYPCVIRADVSCQAGWMAVALGGVLCLNTGRKITLHRTDRINGNILDCRHAPSPRHGGRVLNAMWQARPTMQLARSVQPDRYGADWQTVSRSLCQSASARMKDEHWSCAWSL